MKKFLFLLAAVFSFSYLSCSKKTEYTEHLDSLYDFSYKLAANNYGSKKTFSTYDLYYFPDCLKRFLFYQYQKDGLSLMIIENFHPEKKGELEALDFYCPSSDSGDWVDELLLLVEETRIVDEINLLDEVGEESSISSYEVFDSGLADNSSDTNIEAAVGEESENKTDSVPETEEKDEEEFIYNGEYLGAMKFKDELFLPPQEKSENYLIHSNGKNVTRSFYDDFQRLKKKEYWTVSDFTNARLLKSEAYEFLSDESRSPSRKILVKDDVTQTFFYNEKALCVRREVFTTIDEKEILTSRTDLTYNSEDKLLSEKVQEYSEDKKFTKMRKFVYNNKGLPPDTFYYENEVLKLRTSYSAEKNYISKIFFEDDYSVTSTYVDGIRVKDVYTLGKKVLRVKVYE
ncbi:MAG: hypothetical protein K5829_10350 [Treponema sp.]|nr:hypothetical protein [Treponema sp.]